jgi:hypothetical protein
MPLYFTFVKYIVDAPMGECVNRGNDLKRHGDSKKSRHALGALAGPGTYRPDAPSSRVLFSKTEFVGHPFAHDELLHLAGDRHREGVDEFDVAGAAWLRANARRETEV